jgi:hypothetical protein
MMNFLSYVILYDSILFSKEIHMERDRVACGDGSA